MYEKEKKDKPKDESSSFNVSLQYTFFLCFPPLFPLLFLTLLPSMAIDRMQVVHYASVLFLKKIKKTLK